MLDTEGEPVGGVGAGELFVASRLSTLTYNRATFPPAAAAAAAALGDGGLMSSKTSQILSSMRHEIMSSLTL